MHASAAYAAQSSLHMAALLRVCQAALRHFLMRPDLGMCLCVYQAALQLSYAADSWRMCICLSSCSVAFFDAAGSWRVSIWPPCNCVAHKSIQSEFGLSICLACPIPRYHVVPYSLPMMALERMPELPLPTLLPGAWLQLLAYTYSASNYSLPGNITVPGVTGMQVRPDRPMCLLRSHLVVRARQQPWRAKNC
jgi:hypothetical protein